MFMLHKEIRIAETARRRSSECLARPRRRDDRKRHCFDGGRIQGNAWPDLDTRTGAATPGSGRRYLRTCDRHAYSTAIPEADSWRRVSKRTRRLTAPEVATSTPQR